MTAAALVARRVRARRLRCALSPRRRRCWRSRSSAWRSSSDSTTRVFWRRATSPTSLLGNAYIAVAAIGMSMVIISGNIDISVGSLIGVLATISGTLAVAGAPIIVTWLAPLVVGILVMTLQGAVIAYLRIPAIVVTLGMLSILKGGLISVTGGKWITDLPQSFHLADIELFGDFADAGADHGGGDDSGRAVDALFGTVVARSMPPAAMPRPRGCAACRRGARS